ncbi:cupin domain-containing protein [Methanocaldococcus fervens]|uniref:Cupin 2 conserved barrel domain protein n=1 Tax=Methanocaldococcus fervens (strain DSM 4213 / JCM 15782 / AG86) TaxID=573064 RepID=C7P5D0_METFA|nr:cupin domain-containing protein [Methanocaldococcus fervens]ACV25308.1 Cupin 2 conserved barrel domain protein [Methanocaldococcus fervens AG86]
MKIIKTEYDKIKPYITKDGSIIRELMHPNIYEWVKQSLAEAIVPVGSKTLLHRHHKSEEIYYILEGKGLMTLGDEKFEVKEGDTILIPPKTDHKIENIGSVPLKILCCSYPPYSHEDTEILEE